MAAPNNMNNLTTLIKRLEAATSRLEDIATSAANNEPSSNEKFQASAGTAGAVKPQSLDPSTATNVSTTKSAPEIPLIVKKFDEIVDGNLKDWVDQSNKLGGPVAQQASAVSQAFSAEREILFVASKAKSPGTHSQFFIELAGDLQKAIENTDQVRLKDKSAEWRHHLSLVADGVGALRWIGLDSKPADFIREIFGGAQMYGDRVLREHKNKNQEQVDWVNAYQKIFKNLTEYVVEYHTNGVAWNKDGIEAEEALKEIRASSDNVKEPITSGGPPPPPPPPPLPTFDNVPPPPPMPKSQANSQGDMGAVFDQLNRGEAVTSGLRKVDPSQMTHKNPSLRANSTVLERSDSTGSASSLRGKSPAPPGKKPKPESMRTKKPPRKELEGNKWIIENYETPTETVEIDAALNQSVLVSRCRGLTLRIHGKANAVSVDSSPRTSLILDSLVSSVDVIKCPDFALQVLGTLPTVLLDQVDAATVYLSKESLETEVFTSKCSSVNVNLPPEEEDGDFIEHPAPEQIRSFVMDGKLVSEIVEHAG